MGEKSTTKPTTPGGRLQAERKRLGLSVSNMASLAGVDKKLLSDWETVTESQSMQAFTALQRLGLDIVYVITGTTMPATLAGPTVCEALAMLPLDQRQRLLLNLVQGEFRCADDANPENAR